MGKFFYSVLNDFKRNKFFTVLILLEILALILIAGSFMQNAQLTDKMADAYKPEYGRSVIVRVDDFQDRKDLRGFENAAYTQNSFFDGKQVIIANPKAVNLFDIPHSGDWFSGEVQSDFAEAVVSKKLKNEYKIGEFYTLDDHTGYKRQIKVIGYLGADDLSVSISFAAYNGLFASTEILLCDNVSVFSSGTKVVVATGYEKQFYIDTYNATAEYLEDSRNAYIKNKFTSDYFSQVMIFIVFALIIVGVFCNSIFKTEENIRRNSIKYIVGEKPSKILLSEIFKAAILFAIPFFIALIVVAAVAASSQPFISWRGFGIASVVVAVVYTFSISAGLVRTLSAKPLKELKR